MKTLFKKVAVFFRVLRALPLLFFISSDKKNKKLQMDIERWCSIMKLSGSYIYCFTYLLSKYKEFRSLYIYRVNSNIFHRTIAKIFYPPMETLYLEAGEIGGGLYIHHGFATIVAADRIGENFWVNQQVTIGHKSDGCPTIGDNVMVTSGAKILGKITVGNNVVVGANAVVVKDVQDNCVMGGIPAKVIKNVM